MAQDPDPTPRKAKWFREPSRRCHTPAIVGAVQSIHILHSARQYETLQTLPKRYYAKKTHVGPCNNISHARADSRPMRRNHACLPGYLMLLMLLFRYFKHLFFVCGGRVGGDNGSGGQVRQQSQLGEQVSEGSSKVQHEFRLWGPETPA